MDIPIITADGCEESESERKLLEKGHEDAEPERDRDEGGGGGGGAGASGKPEKKCSLIVSAESRPKFKWSSLREHKTHGHATTTSCTKTVRTLLLV
ncbi:unnamed protein product [Bemisia tabaci]|uniref:Uncharacterized protein n=1 Tax=Bemisia tabaci TaxID=7038 RepID=A0A9P0AEM1_BEMTA|nr:unnamed protein product [Bemisia tabaci]